MASEPWTSLNQPAYWIINWSFNINEKFPSDLGERCVNLNVLLKSEKMNSEEAEYQKPMETEDLTDLSVFYESES